MTLEYEVKVEGLFIAGHPHQELFSDLKAASTVYDKYVEKYSQHPVILFQHCRNVLKCTMPKDALPPTECPRGHKGDQDGHSVIVQGSKKNWICGICGANWRTDGELNF